MSKVLNFCETNWNYMLDNFVNSKINFKIAHNNNKYNNLDDIEKYKFVCMFGDKEHTIDVEEFKIKLSNSETKKYFIILRNSKSPFRIYKKKEKFILCKSFMKIAEGDVEINCGNGSNVNDEVVFQVAEYHL